MSKKTFNKGDVFGFWAVIEPYPVKGKSFALCRCECGVEKKVGRTHLRTGASTKCIDCYNKIGRPEAKTHGMSGTKIHSIWKGMKGRINNPQGRDIENYRNVNLSEDWNSFENFYRDMGDIPLDGKRYSIGRIDNNGNYCKENCRWETDIQQANNTSRTHWIDYKGERMSMANFSRKYGINYSTLRNKLYKGQSPEEILCGLTKNVL